MSNLVEIRDLRKTFGDFTLSIDSLDIPRGYVTGIIGNNGAGKTTLIKCITGGIVPDSGSVIWKKEPMNGNVGMIMDACPFNLSQNSRDVNRVLKHLFSNWDQDRFNELCKGFGLNEKQAIMQYSTGMKKKIQVAALLSHPIESMFLDEPTAGMDPAFRDEFLETIRKFMQEEEHTVVISSHITSDLEKIADYLVFIKDGQIIIRGEKDEVLNEYGMVRSGVEDIDPKYIIGTRRRRYERTALVCSRKEVEELYPDIVVEKATIEEIMIYSMRRDSQ